MAKKAANPRRRDDADLYGKLRRRGNPVFARLMDAAAERKISQEELARRSGIRPGQLSLYRNARDQGKGPSHGELVLLAEIIGVDLRDYLADAPPPGPPLAFQVGEVYKIVSRLGAAAARFEEAVEGLEQIARNPTGPETAPDVGEGEGHGPPAPATGASPRRRRA